jgi:hypothetical protein
LNILCEEAAIKVEELGVVMVIWPRMYRRRQQEEAARV